MKTFSRVDLILQTMLFLAALSFVVAAITGGLDYIMLLLLTQFIMGIAQVISAVVHLAASAQRRKQRILHLLLAAGYLMSYAPLMHFVSTVGIGFYIINSLAWALAAFYYAISFRTVIPRKTSASGFLPHLSF
jgi:predicted acyltransferase